MKFKIGDKVRIKEDLSQCKFGGSIYINEYAGKEATVTETYDSGLIQLDIDDGEWNWSEGVLELIEDSEKKMKRIDYILNAKDLIKVLVEEFDLGLDCCKCHYDDECDGISVNCNDGFIKYLEQKIEVDKSDLKDTDVESTVEAIKNTKEENDPVNPFMEEYKKIVTETMNLCEKKNKDYGSSVQDTFLRFGDLSYLTRITDKYNRILTLINKDNEVKDENLIDTIRDMGNYCFLWLASKRLGDRGDKNE